MHFRAVSIWFVIMVLAIINGGIRERFINPRFGENAGHAISTIMLCTAIMLMAWAAIGWVAPHTVGDAVTVGLTWLMLTLAFEFLAGHYIFGASWEKLLADYDIRAGRVWPLVPLTCFVAPLLAFLAHRDP